MDISEILKQLIVADIIDMDAFKRELQFWIDEMKKPRVDVLQGVTQEDWDLAIKMLDEPSHNEK